MSTVVRLKIYKGSCFTVAKLETPLFFLSLLFTPHPPEKRVPCPLGKSMRSDADEELRREIHEERHPVRRRRNSGSLWCTLPSINPFHPLPQFHSSPTHDSTPWNLKWMAVGNWDTREREVEFAWTQNSEAKKSETHFSKVSVLDFFFHYFLSCFVQISVLVNGFLFICWNLVHLIW